MQVKSFRPSLSYHLSLRSFFVYFECLLKTGFTVTKKNYTCCFTLYAHAYLRTCRYAPVSDQVIETIFTKELQDNDHFMIILYNSFVKLHDNKICELQHTVNSENFGRVIFSFTKFCRKKNPYEMGKSLCPLQV